MSIKGISQTMYVRKKEASIITFWGNKKLVNFGELERVDFMYAGKREPGYIDFVNNDNRITRFEFKAVANEKITRTVNLIRENYTELSINELHVENLKFYERWWFIVLTMLFCCGPIGLFLMWYKRKSTLDFRVTLTILMLVIWGTGTYAIYLTYVPAVNNANAVLGSYYDALNGDSREALNMLSQNDASTDSDVYKASTYKVGKDMPAGEYVLIADNADIRYFQVSSDSTGSADAILANGIFQSNTIVTVSNGQYFNFIGCHATPITEAPALDTTKDGMFKVGTHIDPGEYQIWPSENAEISYYAVLKDSTHMSESIKSNGILQGREYVTLEKGEYLELTGCYIME